MKSYGFRTLLVSAAFVLAQAATAQAAPSLCNGPANGIIDGNEQCETGPCCTAKCELRAPSTVCRASTGPCDPAETCGALEPTADAACPADALAEDGTECSDGLTCTTGETCSEGVCGGGLPSCDDGNSCTADSCKEPNKGGQGGGCSYSNASDGTPCDDGNACTTDDVCQGGQCVGGSAVTCDDGNACTDDVCDPTSGECVSTNNSAPCEDGLFCTAGDTCADGQCVSGSGTPCTTGGACAAGFCDEDTDSCSYQQAVDGSPCDDGKFCTVGETCTGGVCGGGAPNTCDDGNECTSDSCSEAQKSCRYSNTNQNKPCDDGLFCTVDGICRQGQCVGQPLDCGDGNVCTDDSCNEDTDQCDNLPNTAPCDDGLFCTSNDTCSDGTCSNTTPTCSDGNVCTDDVCDEAAASCSYPDNTAPCDDGLFCTVNDTCGGGTCQAGPARDCGDGNVCTTDSCDEGADACVNANNTDPCDDGLFCTVGDVCGGGTCSGTPRNCGDGNACTTDSCNEATDACVNAANTLPCDDGLFCTVGDACSNGACVGGPARDCGDGDDCTDDSCDEAADSCVNEPNSEESCDDGNACTTGDACVNGACVGEPVDCGDDNDCTDDSCDPSSGECSNTPNTDPCDDGLFCTTDDACDDGICTGQARDCEDGDVCTDNACNEDTDSCDAINNTAPCDDGNACTGGDACVDGVCVAGEGPGCDDGNECTEDSCAEDGVSCENVPVPDGTECDDGNICTGDDACSEGICVGEEIPDCTTTTTSTSTTSTTEEPSCPPFPCGDTNEDCEVTASDALFVLRAGVGLVDCPLSVCDYNGDGRVSALDALAVLRDAVGLPSNPNCPE